MYYAMLIDVSETKQFRAWLYTLFRTTLYIYL